MPVTVCEEMALRVHVHIVQSLQTTYNKENILLGANPQNTVDSRDEQRKLIKFIRYTH